MIALGYSLWRIVRAEVTETAPRAAVAVPRVAPVGAE